MGKSWAVDDMVIHKIVEDEYGYTHVRDFLPNLSPERLNANLAWFSQDGYDAKHETIFLSYHSFIVETPRHRVLIDSCIGNHKTMPMREAWNNKTSTRWLDEFAATGLRFQDIDYVLCTHLHHDHVGWNTRRENGRWVPTFPNARHLIVDREYEFTRDWVETRGGDSPLGQAYMSAFHESVAPIFTAGQADLVACNHVVGEYFRLMPTPGHTPGHVAVLAGRERDAAVFTGDMIHSPIQALFPDVIVPFDFDATQAVQTRRAFLERFRDTQTLVCTMHFPDPSVGYLRSWDGGYRIHYIPPQAPT